MHKLKQYFLSDSLLVPVVSILLGFLLGGVIMLIGAYNPITAYVSLLDQAFGNLYRFGETIRAITPLIFTGLAVAFAFRTGLFNIGAEGQFIVGTMAAAYTGIVFKLPWYIHAPLAVLAGGILGGIWGSIAGYLKAKRGVHEVISTIMLNWIALFLTNYIIRSFLLEPGQLRTKVTEPTSWISIPALSQLFGNARIHLGILIAFICAYLFYVILWKTKQGFELRAVGISPSAAEYAGIAVDRNITKAMLISGFFAGIGGAAEVLGVFHYQSINTVPQGYGFIGIAVALIGRNTALGTVLGAILLGVLNYGRTGMKFGAGVPEELINIVIAMVIFFVAASGIVKSLVGIFRRKQKEAL